LAQVLAIQVLSRHLGRHLGRNFGNFIYLFFGTVFYAYSLNFSQIGSLKAELFAIQLLSCHVGAILAAILEKNYLNLLALYFMPIV